MSEETKEINRAWDLRAVRIYASKAKKQHDVLWKKWEKITPEEVTTAINLMGLMHDVLLDAIEDIYKIVKDERDY